MIWRVVHEGSHTNYFDSVAHDNQYARIRALKVHQYCVVLGCPRSGTTFVAGVLRAVSHSEYFKGDNLFVTVPHVLNHAVSEEIRHALGYGLRNSLEWRLGGATNSLIAACKRWSDGCGSLAEVLEAFRRRREVKWLIYKEPFLAFAPDFAWEAFPGAHVIHIVRDGRDCADSLVRTFGVLSDERLKRLENNDAPMGRKHGDRFVPWWVEGGREHEFLSVTPFVRSAWMWKEMMRRCHPFFSDPSIRATGRVLEVKYEQLVNAPVREGRRIMEFLGAEWNNRIEKQLLKGHSSSIGIHKQRQPKEVMEATRIARAELELYGYR